MYDDALRVERMIPNLVPFSSYTFEVTAVKGTKKSRPIRKVADTAEGGLYFPP